MISQHYDSFENLGPFYKYSTSQAIILIPVSSNNEAWGVGGLGWREKKGCLMVPATTFTVQIFLVKRFNQILAKFINRTFISKVTYTH